MDYATGTKSRWKAVFRKVVETMKLLMLCREPRLYSCQRLKQAAEKRGYTMDILDPNRCMLVLEDKRSACYYQAGEHNDKVRPIPYLLDKYYGVLGRFGASSTIAGCNVLRYFESQGIASLNSAAAFELARDKWRSLQHLHTKGMPIPSTSISGSSVSSSAILQPFSSPSIIKTCTGSQGVGVMLVETFSSAKSIVDTLTSNQIPFLVQQFIQEAAGQDIRAFVIGGKVVAAMERQGKVGEFRANIHQGGSAKPCQLSDEEQQLAVKATLALGLDVGGVDLIRSEQGTMILEVNASPGLEMIEKVSQMEIAEQMIDYLLAKI